MDFWFHFGTFGVPWATQWHHFSLPGPGRVGLLGSLGGRLAFILQPCGVSKDECQRASGARLAFILWPDESGARLAFILWPNETHFNYSIKFLTE